MGLEINTEKTPKQLTILLDWSEEDEVWVVSMPALNYSGTFQTNGSRSTLTDAIEWAGHLLVDCAQTAKDQNDDRWLPLLEERVRVVCSE